MPEYRVDPIRTKDEDGNLVTAGVRWDEYSAGSTKFTYTVGFVLCCAGGLGFLIGLLGLPMLVLIGIVLLAIGGGIIWLAFSSATRSRTLVFHRDGKILAPQALPFYEGVFAVSGEHQHVLSIEVTGKTYTHPSPTDEWQKQAVNVALIFSGGQTVYVARDLSVELARNVAVQLTHALEVFRKPPGHAPAPRGPQGPKPDDDIID